MVKVVLISCVSLCDMLPTLEKHTDKNNTVE